MIRNKTIKFNLDKKEDRELWDWLSTQPHGTFSEVTKKFWELSKKDGSRINEVMHDEYWDDIKLRVEEEIK